MTQIRRSFADFASLTGPDGICVVNADDANVKTAMSGIRALTLTFSGREKYDPDDPDHADFYPASIDMSDGASYTFTAQSLNLSDGQMLVINATNLDDQNRMTLTSGNNTTKKVFVRSDTGLSVDQNCAAVFYGDSLVSEISFWLNADESSSAPKAGQYAGVLNFEISIVDRG